MNPPPTEIKIGFEKLEYLIYLSNRFRPARKIPGNKSTKKACKYIFRRF